LNRPVTSVTPSHFSTGVYILQRVRKGTKSLLLNLTKKQKQFSLNCGASRKEIPISKSLRVWFNKSFSSAFNVMRRLTETTVPHRFHVLWSHTNREFVLTNPHGAAEQ